MAPRSAGMGFILITLFLDVLGIGVIVPIFPQLVRSLVGGSEVLGAQYLGYIYSSYAVMQFLCSPIMGNVSDRFGRRPVLLAAVTAQALAYATMGLAPSLGWLFASRIFAGITGASIGTATAYIADVSPPEKRSQNFGFVGIAFGLGFIFGPVLGGVLSEVDLRLPFFVSAGLALCNALYGFFVLPESLAPELRRPFSWSKANPLGTVGVLKRYPLVASLSITIFLAQLAQRCLESTWVIFTGHRFGWTAKPASLSLGVVGICAALVQGGLVRRVIPLLGERRTITAGLLIMAGAFTAYAFAPAPWVLYAIMPFGALGGLAAPATQGLLSRAVPPTEQGMLQGGVSSLTALTQIVGPLLATSTFSYFISDRAPFTLPGAPLLLGAAVVVVALVAATRTFARHPASPALG